MAFQLPYIQPLSFEQNNPFLYGRKMGDEHRAQQLANALQQIKLQYAPRRESAETLLAEAQPDYTKAQTKSLIENLKKIPAEMAQMYGSAHASNASAALNEFYRNNPEYLFAETASRADLAKHAPAPISAESQPAQNVPPSQYQLSSGMQQLSNSLPQAGLQLQAQGPTLGSVPSNVTGQGNPLVSALKQVISGNAPAPEAPAASATLPQPQRALNPYQLALEKEQSEIARNNALAQTAGDRYGTPQEKAINTFTNQLRKDHPGWSEEKLQGASGNYIQGIDEYQGEKLPPLSGQSGRLLDDIYRKSSTANAYNTSLRAQQADAAANSLTESANEFRGGEGSTYFNIPVEDAIKQFSDDPKNEDKLAGIIAANAIQTEAVKEQLFRIGARPTVTDTKEILQQAMQREDIPNVRMSNRVRQLVAQKMLEASKRAFQARQSVSTAARDVLRKSDSNTSENNAEKMPAKPKTEKITGKRFVIENGVVKEKSEA